MKVRELVEILRKYDGEEDIEMIAYDDQEYTWWAIERLERFIPEDETSPLLIVAGEIVGC